jgi:hypothetical protein
LAFRAHACRELERSQEFEAAPPEPVTQADAELTKVNINSAEMMAGRRITG